MFDDFDNLSLEELHKLAYATRDKEDNFNYGDFEDMSSESEEFCFDTMGSESEDYKIEDYTRNPYDYGSEEYLKVMEKLKKRREEYRNKQLNKQSTTSLIKSHQDKSRH